MKIKQIISQCLKSIFFCYNYTRNKYFNKVSILLIKYVEIYTLMILIP